jgi:hypothetical protein
MGEQAMKMVLRIMALCCVFLAGSAAADDHMDSVVETGADNASSESVVSQEPLRIYKSVGKDGVPSFSSDSVDGAEEIELKPSNSVRITPTKPSTFVVPEEPEKKDYKVSISSPENDKHYHNDPKPVPVAVSVSPALEQGYSLEVTDNGALLADASGKYVLEFPERGEHRLVARVVDDKGEVLAESKAVTIFVHRVSQLTNPQFSKPKPKPKNR